MPWSKEQPSPWRIKPGERLSPLTEFQKGLVPTNKLPVGSITVRTRQDDGQRAWIKIADPNQWGLLAVHVWRQAYGPIPRGYVVHHQNQDPLDDALSNLVLLTRAEHRRLHQPELQAGKEGLILHKKSLVCSLCGQDYIGKKYGICPSCAEKHRSQSRRSWKQRQRVSRLAQQGPPYCTTCKGPYDGNTVYQRDVLRCSACKAKARRAEVREYKKRIRAANRAKREASTSRSGRHNSAAS